MARTDNCFEVRFGAYITPTNPLGDDLVLSGSNRYLNFGNVWADSGYGIRDLGGIMQFKDVGGSWLAITNAVTGANAALSNLSGVAINTALLTIDGTVGAPAYSWTTDPTTGLYHTGTGATGAIYAGVNGVNVLTMLAAGKVGIGTTTPNAKLVVAGSTVIGTAALATNATDGFLYIPTMTAGVPSGVPTAQSGTIPLVFDTTNGRLWVYSGGTWT